MNRTRSVVGALAVLLIAPLGLTASHAATQPNPESEETVVIEAFAPSEVDWQSGANQALDQIRETYPDDFADAFLSTAAFDVWFRATAPAGAVQLLNSLDVGYAVHEQAGFTELERAVAVELIHDRAGEYLGDGVAYSTGPVAGTAGIEVEFDAPTTFTSRSSIATKSDVGLLDYLSARTADTPADGFNISADDDVPSGLEQQGYGHAGGSAISSDSGVICTSGFVAKSTTSADLGVLTAGHCPNRMRENGTGGSYYFVFRAEHQGANGDIQWLASPKMMDSWFHVKKGVGAPVLAVAGATAGTSICHYGVFSLDSCGYVKQAGMSVTLDNGSVLGNLTKAEGANLLASEGDSGGPWYGGNTAYGTHVGQKKGANALYFSPISASVRQFGVTVCIEGRC
ncbi:S1 family peptidase [Clavibacter michiganensis]|uniref:S1 family peptidase n=1 Tax=Clavibacter michiganensis TaxID=28447 RepID=UPI0026DCA953|nr:S1 family peptidase [Clavibacter michiganensis]MDO4144197.1 S1 family peptidase [Clavibacter michiganensis]